MHPLAEIKLAMLRKVVHEAVSGLDDWGHGYFAATAGLVGELLLTWQ